MMAEGSGSVPTVAPPVRRQLFKTSSLPKPALTEEELGVSLFSRSRDNFAAVLEEHRESARRREQSLERRREEQLANQARQGNARSTSRASVSSQDEVTVPRQNDGGSTSSPSPDSHKRKGAVQQHHVSSSPPLKVPRITRSTPTKPVVVPLDHSDDDLRELAKPILDTQDVSQVRRVMKQYGKGLEPGSDELEEFPELIEKARAKRAKESQQQTRLAAALAKLRGESVADGSAGAGVPAMDDRIIQLLITSRLPGTKPLLVKRKLAQRMKEVLEAWTAHQPDHLKHEPDFFFTWKGFRLFGTSTGRSLGIVPSATGVVTGEGEGYQSGKIHIEVWTEDAFAEHKRKIEAERQRLDRPHDYKSSEETAVVATSESAIKWRITMKAGGKREPVLVKGNPKTLLSKLAFIYQRGAVDLPPGTQVVFRFEGEELDPNMTLEEADLDDDVVLDVHFKASEETADVAPPEPAIKWRVRMMAANGNSEPVLIKGSPQTPISKLVHIYKQRVVDLPVNSEVVLRFKDQDLNPILSLDEAGLHDEVVLVAYVK